MTKEHKHVYSNMCWLMVHEAIFTSIGLVDLACINYISPDALIGATFAMVLYNMMFQSHQVFSKALRVVASRLFGAKDEVGIQSGLMCTTIITVSIAVLFTTAYLLFGEQFLTLFSLSPEQRYQCHIYMMSRLPGYIVFAITSPIVRSFEAKGQVAKVTKVRFCNFVNLPFSILLMMPLGVFGVGMGSTLTEVVELIVVYLVFKPKYAKPQKRYFSDVAKFGASYLPESLISPITNTILSNLCLIYLSTSVLVISQLVNKFYDEILSIMYMITQHAEIVIGREYGAGNKDNLLKEFKLFKHCYVWVILIHIPITFVFGYVYLALISNVSDIWFAMVLLAARLLCEVAYYIEQPARRILYIFGVIKPIMIVRLIGLTVVKLSVLYLALICGAGAFCLPLCYLASDLPSAVMNTHLLRKKLKEVT